MFEEDFYVVAQNVFSGLLVEIAILRGGRQVGAIDFHGVFGAHFLVADVEIGVGRGDGRGHRSIFVELNFQVFGFGAIEGDACRLGGVKRGFQNAVFVVGELELLEGLAHGQLARGSAVAGALGPDGAQGQGGRSQAKQKKPHG